MWVSQEKNFMMPDLLIQFCLLSFITTCMVSLATAISVDSRWVFSYIRWVIEELECLIACQYKASVQIKLKDKNSKHGIFKTRVGQAEPQLQ